MTELGHGKRLQLRMVTGRDTPATSHSESGTAVAVVAPSLPARTTMHCGGSVKEMPDAPAFPVMFAHGLVQGLQCDLNPTPQKKEDTVYFRYMGQSIAVAGSDPASLLVRGRGHNGQP